MMRFPALLTATIAKDRVARILQGKPSPFLTFVDPAELLHPGSAHPVSHEKVRQLISTRARGVWIGGSEPLDHPGIAHLIRATAPSGHLIFLETNGVLLRLRIHEFQPLPQVFLVVRPGTRTKPNFDLSLEGLRAARLSGFFTIVHSLIAERADRGELDRLRCVILEMDLDGWLITAASGNASATSAAAEARELIPSAAWRRFSSRVERELLAQEKSRESTSLPGPEKSQTSADVERVTVA